MSVRAGFFAHDDNRSIVVRRWMIEATRQESGDADLAAALMLAQVTFWTQPDERTGKVRGGHEHGQHSWLVRGDDGWHEELGMALVTARRCRRRLVALGWIEARTLVDGGVRCTHLRRLNPQQEPSTIRSGSAIDQAESNGDPEQMREPILNESHAGASSSLGIGEVVETKALAPEAPAPDVAREVVTAFWQWCKDQGKPTPTVGRSRGNPFVALIGVVRQLLDAGHPAPAVKRALTTTRAYTVDALTFELRKATTDRDPLGPGSTTINDAWAGVASGVIDAKAVR